MRTLIRLDILSNRNITSKHLGRKGLHLNKASFTRLAKNIIYKLKQIWWSLEHLNESPARVSINVSWPTVSCDSLNSNYMCLLKMKWHLLKACAYQMSIKILLIVNLWIILNLPSHDDWQNLGSKLRRVRIENLSRIIFGRININSIRNKFDLLINIIKNEMDIFMISETRIGNSFSISQFTERLLNFFQGWSHKSWGWNTFVRKRRYSL